MISQTAAEYLRSMPLVQWQQQKLTLSLDDVAAAARAKGLRFAPTDAINSSDYVVYSASGQQIRRGSLSAIRYYIQNY